MCAYENPAFDPGDSSSESEEDCSRRTTSHGDGARGKTCRKTSLRESALAEEKTKYPTAELSDDFEDSDDDYPSVVSGQLADIVPYDEIAPFLHVSRPGKFQKDSSRSSSESEMASPCSVKSPALSSDITGEAVESEDDESGCDLVWDAYTPALTVQWSDVMIKQIFDTVEKDNEDHVTKIREIAHRTDIRPLNILQRLYW